ncbi:MAG: hypothetical protein WCF04_15445 [Candidatus Nanopelagicales bacterium]
MTAGQAPAPMAAIGAATPEAGAGRGSTITGSGLLLRLALRRDRILLPAWVLGLSAMATFSARATVELYPEIPTRVAAAEAVNGSAALVALYGRIYDPTSLGELSLFKMTAFGAAMVGAVTIFLVVRHTRAEEEAGRLELVGAGVVGRSAPLVAGLLLVLICAVGITVLTAAGLTWAGLPMAGSIAFGAAWGATGLLFAAVGGIAAQVTTSGRAATGLGMIALAVAYVARAVGDLAEEGPGWLSWLSPIGWSQQVRAFSGTRWSLLALPVLATAVLVPVAFLLRSRRDLGGGMVADRPGPAEGRLGTPSGLAWRLQRPTLLSWVVATAILGTILGSVASNVSGFLDSPQMKDILEALGGKQGLTDMFLAAEVGLMATILAGYGISAVHWLPAEEEGGRAEMVLATAASRRAWATSHAVQALLGVAVLLTVMGLAIGVGHAVAVSDSAQVLRLASAAAVRVPAAWVMVGLAVATWGWRPGATWVAWALFVLFLVLGEFGALWDLPDWVMDLSPFAHSPVMPGPDPSYVWVPVLLVIGLGLVAFGIGRFMRRDVVSA